jgi:hypothetical protein
MDQTMSKIPYPTTFGPMSPERSVQRAWDNEKKMTNK